MADSWRGGRAAGGADDVQPLPSFLNAVLQEASPLSSPTGTHGVALASPASNLEEFLRSVAAEQPGIVGHTAHTAACTPVGGLFSATFASEDPTVKDTSKKRKRERKNLTCACDACRKSKVKCDGKEPCARCAKRGTTCHYSPQKRRGFPARSGKVRKTNTVLSVASGLAKQQTEAALLTSHNAGVAKRMDLFALKTSLLEVYFSHFYAFTFRLVPKDVIVYPRTAPHRLIQTIALALSARSLQTLAVRQEIENEMRVQARDLYDMLNLQVAKGFSLLASYYHGEDINRCYHFMALSRSICERLQDRFPDSGPLRLEAMRIQLMIVCACDIEISATINPWIDELQRDVERMHISPPGEFCPDEADFSVSKTPFSNMALRELFHSLGSASSRQFWALCMKNLNSGTALPQPTRDEMHQLLLELLYLERVWSSNVDLTFFQPVVDLCMVILASALFTASRMLVEAEHYLYAALVLLKSFTVGDASVPNSAMKLELAPSWLLSYFRFLFRIAVHLGRMHFAVEILKLEFMLSQVICRYEQFYREHFCVLKDLAASGLYDFTLPDLTSSTSVTLQHLPIMGGISTLQPFSALDHSVTSLLAGFPGSAVMTAWLQTPSTPALQDISGEAQVDELLGASNQLTLEALESALSGDAAGLPSSSPVLDLPSPGLGLEGTSGSDFFSSLLRDAGGL